jgi:hypothetical protein
MITVTIEASDAVSIASLINLSDPKTLGLDSVFVSSSTTRTVAIATDRYVLGRYTAEEPATLSGLIDWKLTANACKFITANVKPINKWHTPTPLTVEINPENNSFTINTGQTTFSDTWTLGPHRTTSENLGRLVDDWKPAELALPNQLAIKFLVKLSKLVNGFSKIDKYVFQIGANDRNPSKPGPIMASANGGWEVLIQPNLMNN